MRVKILGLGKQILEIITQRIKAAILGLGMPAKAVAPTVFMLETFEQVLNEMYCSHQCLSIDLKKSLKAHSNAHNA